jgi:hypothetical protein
MKIIIGRKEFTATVLNNATANALLEKLPLVITMEELNGNEKYYYFSEKFPFQPVNPGMIQAGDLMLYEDCCLVLFYERFATRYRYSKIGSIQNTKGLKEALGGGKIEVQFLKE